MKNLLKSILMLVLFSSAMHAQQITSVAPNNGLAGSQVTISGSGFSSTASENEVFFGKSKANVISVNAAGTELVVNTPTNPSYPFNINVFNASNTTWITSDVRFAFTYKAKINPTSRNFGDQYQSSTAETNTFTNWLQRRSLGDFKGATLLATDFNGDKELDIYLQKTDDGGFPDGLRGGNYWEHSVLMNENDIFTLSPQGNGGFIETESGTSNWSDPAIKQTGILSADLNNDGKAEVVVYGARVHNGASENIYFTPSFAVLESNTSANSSSFSLTSSSNTPQNIFTITSDGGWDFLADQMTPDNGQYLYGVSNVQNNNPHIENSGDKLLYQTSVLAMEAVDIDKDGDLDIVALLSWPMLREEQVGSNRVNRAQIYIFKNTTTPGSSTFTFNNSQYKTGSTATSQAVSGYLGLYPNWGAYSSHADWGNFLGPDKVIELQNSSFTGYDINKWISDFKVSDLDDDGDFDIIVKGINEVASYSSRRIDTTNVYFYAPGQGSSKVSLDWLYFRGKNKRSGLQAASGTGKGFLSFFENTTTGSSLSFTETTVDAAVANNKKFDFGGIDVCDIDNDGDKDIVIAAPDNTADTTANPNINIYLQSAGSFSQPVVLSAPTASTINTSSQHMDNQGAVISRLKCVDINGDNLKDILITGTNMDGLFSYMRLPAQTTISSSSYSIQNFLTAGTATAKFRAPFDVTIADFSNDGKVDLVVHAPLKSNSGDAPMVTYLKNNNGDPTILTNASLGIFTKCTNDPSGAESLTIGGINISQAKGRQIKASVNSDYEICLDPTANNWSSNVLLSPDAYNDVEATEVFIRAKSSATTPVFTGTLTLTSPEAETVTFDLNGALDLPIGGTVSPAVQFVNTSNTASTPATTTPAATAAPVAVTVSESFGTIQWQKSTDNSTWTDISGATTDTYTLPYAEINNEGEVFLRAELTRCTEVAYSETALILENLGAPAPPSLAASNGQSISGTYDNGLTTKLEVYEDGTLIATCSDLVNGCSGWTFVNGTFTYTPSTGFTTGASITSKAYNSTVSSILSTAVIVDATAPTVPTINVSNGTSITGTAEAGSTVSITYNSTTVTVVADASGNYTHYPQIPISDGSSITVTASDEVGNVSNSVSQNVDAVAPTITPDASDVNGVPLTGLSTLTGNTESGATVEVTLDDGTTYQVIADSNGDFTATFSPVITEGDNVYVTVTDQAGNTSSISTFVADGTAPSAPVANPSNGTVISGTGEAGSTVTFTYTVSGTQYSETAAVDGSGNYSFTPSVTIPDNTVVSVTNTDAVGNESASTDITTDGISPVITSIEDANGNAISNTSTVEGSTEPNSEITVTIGGTTYSGMADSDGNYSIDISAAGLSDGDSYTLIATDPAGNTSNTETVTVDDTAPTAPSVTEINGYVGTTISGSNAEPNSTITVSDGTNTWTTVANANGDYSVEISGSVNHNAPLTITNTDAVGNTSTSTTTTLYNQPPVLTPSFTTNSQAQAGQTLEGNTDANAVVTAVLPDGTSITATANSTGDFSFDLSSYSLDDGDQISVTAENEYGNESSSLTWNVDATAPTANIYATNGASFSGVLDGEGYTVSLAYGSPVLTQNLTVTGSSFDWTPSSSLGLSVGDQVTYTITDEVGNETTYTITVQAEVYCIPAHSTGIAIEELTFKPGVSGASDVTFSTFLSDTYSDRTTTTTIELEHDAKPEFFARSASNTTVYYKIWVDYNQDGDFSDNDEAIDGSSTSQNLSSTNPLVFHSWTDISITNPLPDVPFENLADGSEYTMRIGLSSTAAGVSDPCGSSSATANFQDIKIKVLNCLDPSDFTAVHASNGSAQLDVDFSLELSSLDITYVIAKAQSPFDNPFNNGQYDNVDDWLTQNSATATTATMSGTLNGSGNYDYSFSSTVDSEGNNLTLGSYYAVALKRSCTAPKWVQYESSQGLKVVELKDPSAPDYGGSDFAITSHTHTQTFSQTQQGNAPGNTLVLPVGEALSVKTTVKGSDGSTVVTPTTFNYFDVNGFFSSGSTFILGTIDATAASGLGQTALAVANTNEVVYSVNPSSPTAYWLTYTFTELATGGMPLDAFGLGFAKSVNVAWYAPPALNTDNDGLTGCVPDETVTIVWDGVTYSGTAGSDGTIAFASLLNNGNALSGVNNGSFVTSQTWTSGGATHTNTKQQLSTLSINAGSNGVTGTAAPGATVTLTLGDETFTTTADATTGIYDFSGTTSSSTAPSTGVAFNTLVPFTSTTAYTINQSLAGYTAAADVTGSILAATSDIAVPTIDGALALTGTQTTVAGTAEAGSQVYLYDEDGNQLFDASGDPITATADDQGDYSITVDLSTAQISTGSNTFSAAYSSPYTGEVMQVGSTDTDGNTAPLSAAFVNPSVYTSSGTWTDASGTSISAPSTSGAATSSSPVIRYESNATLPSGITGLSGVEVASGATLTVPTDGCLDVAGSLAVQGTGSISLGAALNTGGPDVESAQLKFTGEYLGPPTLEMNGYLFKSAHTIGSPMKEGFVSSDLGDETKLIGWDAYTAGTYYSAGEAIATQGLGFYAIVGSNQFIAQAGGFDVIGSPMSSLDMSLGYVADNYSSTSAGSGWNMIANPYTCGWDWGASNLSNVATTFYIYDVANSSWKLWNSTTNTGTGLTSAVIPPLQGIWVQTTSAGASVSSTMDAAGELTCASGSSQNGFLKTAIGKYKLTTVAQDDSADYAEMYLLDIAGAQQGFDADYDAWHMNGHLSRGKVYQAVGQEELVLNAMEIASTTAVDIAFDSDHMNKTYRLELSTEAVDTTLEVLLEDRYEGGLWSLDKGAYVFEHIASPVGVKQTRFELRFVQKSEQTIGEQEQDLEAGVKVAGNTLTIQHPDRYVSYQIFDSQGRTIANAVVTPTIVLPTEQWPNGIYRIVLLGAQTTTVSIVVQH